MENDQVVVKSVFLRGVSAIPCTVTIKKGKGFSIKGVSEVVEKEIRTATVHAFAQVNARNFGANVSVEPFCDSASSLFYPIVEGVLSLYGHGSAIPENAILFGELSLQGALRPVRGAACFAKYAAENDLEAWGPHGNAAEMLAVAPSSSKTVGWLGTMPTSVLPDPAKDEPSSVPSFRPFRERFQDEAYPLVFGERFRRSILIAAAGDHPLLLVGSPGGGKTLAARALSTILPPMSERERDEVILSYSAAGLFGNGFVQSISRPFRAPHHTASTAGLVGGGAPLRPGEATLAHNGVLFLDELGEFTQQTMSAVAGALDDGYVDVARGKTRVKMPARFLLVAATDPCPCGFYESPQCSCSAERVKYYRRRLAPLLDRFDMVTAQPSESNREHGPSLSHEEASRRVVEAREILEQHLPAGRYTSTASDLFRATEERLGRQRTAVLRRVSRTIAALGGRAVIELTDIQEALGHTRGAAFPIADDEARDTSFVTSLRPC